MHSSRKWRLFVPGLANQDVCSLSKLVSFRLLQAIDEMVISNDNISSGWVLAGVKLVLGRYSKLATTEETEESQGIGHS